MAYVDSRLGLNDTLPFGKYKGQKIEDVYKVNAGYLMWLRDEKADPKPKDGESTAAPPNREFFDVEVLKLLNLTILNDPKGYRKHKPWPGLNDDSPEDDTPFEPESANFYTTWGAF